MTITALFPTFIYSAQLARRGQPLNRQLLRECRQLRDDDAAGRAWSAENYPGGYTSYGSVHWLQRISPTFKSLEQKLDHHVLAFARALDWDLEGRELHMTDCWINIMPKRVVHGVHLHPLSSVSGTYYVQVPAGAPGLKFEDPRLDRFMAAPPRKLGARRENRAWGNFAARPGKVLLFESWLRHEVVTNRAAAERISISFNYNWF